MKLLGSRLWIRKHSIDSGHSRHWQFDDNIEDIRRDKILKRTEDFLKKDFILDMRPFVPFNERDKLGDFLTISRIT